MDGGQLCHACKAFDVRALYELALESTRKSKPAKPKVSGFPVYKGFPLFHKLHNHLRSLLHAASSGCQLCTAILEQAAQNVPKEFLDPTRALDVDDSGRPIYLGLSDWDPEADGMPYLTAIQPLPRGERNLATFELFVDPQDVPPGYEQLLARAVEPDSASDASIRVLQSWHRNCLANHPPCARQLFRQRPLPTRVLDVGDANTNPKMIATNGSMGEWAALNYCWGGNSSFVLNTETSMSLFGGYISLAEYPKTLQDAIIITRALNLQYLWIDALCIIQDSPNDWATEASRMKDVYGGASITIAASSSTGTAHGIFKTRSISHPACKLNWQHPVASRSHSIYLRSVKDFWDTTLRYEPLNTRGWTLQESLLAQRTVSYGTQQMFWECQCLKTGESGRPILPREQHRDKAFVQSIISNDYNMWQKTKLSLTRMSLNFMPVGWSAVFSAWEQHYEAMYGRWYAIVLDYTGRELTVQTDILPALSGLAATFNNVLQDQYCAGLWRNNIIRELCWSRLRFPRERKPDPEAQDSALPSWSWAKVTTGRLINTMAEEDAMSLRELKEIAVLVDVSVVSKLPDNFGQVTSAYITIRAPFLFINGPQTLGASEHSAWGTRLDKGLDRTFTDKEFKQQHQTHSEQQFAIVRLMITSKTVVYGGAEAYRPRAEIMVLESAKSELTIVKGRARSGHLGRRKRVDIRLWRRVGFFSVDTSWPPENDGINEEWFEDMKKAKWEWREVTII